MNDNDIVTRWMGVQPGGKVLNHAACADAVAIQHKLVVHSYLLRFEHIFAATEQGQ
ncbi:MAG: hypothetical protein AAFQ58_17095 [Pseudomonadota bacterium]